MTQDYEVGKRYPMTAQDAKAILGAMGLGAILMGRPDLTRGRRFVKKPADWEFWNTDGKKISVSFTPGQSFIGSCANDVDPELPEPL